jgi:hypothetical protein
VVPNLAEASAESEILTTEADTEASASVSAEYFGQPKLRYISINAIDGLPFIGCLVRHVTLL